MFTIVYAHHYQFDPIGLIQAEIENDVKGRNSKSDKQTLQNV